MIGNDIVDLTIARNSSLSTREYRFHNKIFSKEEIEIINKDTVSAWAIWAMKEAVYKAHHRRFNLPRYFDPKAIAVHISKVSDNLISAGATYRDHKYWGRGRVTLDYVHFTATSFPLEQMFNSKIFSDTSINVKTRFKKAVSSKLGLEFHELDIVKDQNFIPHLRYEKVNLNLPFSISHHGKFAAFSFQLMNY